MRGFLSLLLVGLVSCLPLAWLVPSAAESATYYVANGGAGTCGSATSIGTPLGSIGASQGCANPGDTVIIRGGTYDERLQDGWNSGSATEGTRITVKAQDGETVTWRAPGTGNTEALYLSGATQHHLTFQNILFDGKGKTTRLPAITGNCNTTDSTSCAHHITFMNCEFRNASDEITVSRTHHNIFLGGSIHDNNDTTGLRHGIYLASYASDNIIDGMEIYNNQGYGIHMYNDEGAFSDRNIVRNNTIYNNALCCGQNNVILSGTDATQFYNNVVYGGASGVVVGYAKGSTNVVVYNNTIEGTGSARPGLWIQGTNTTVKNNILYNNAGGDYVPNGSTTDANNLVGINPLFVSLATHQYQLLAGSPAIGAGVAVGISTDHDGNPYPSPPDIGAYAYGTAFTPTIGTFYAAGTGTPNTDCEAAKTLSTPYIVTDVPSMTGFLACGASQSTFVFLAGTYVASIVTSASPIAGGTATTPTTVKAQTGATVVLKKTHLRSVIRLDRGSSDSYIVFDGLTLDGDFSSLSNGLVLLSGAHHITFQNGTILEMENQAVACSSADTLRLVNNNLHHTGIGATSVVELSACTSPTLTRNDIHHSSAQGIYNGSSTGAQIQQNTIHDNATRGIDEDNSAGSLLANNLIYSNGGTGLTVFTGSSAAKVYNNTFWSNIGAPIQINSGASATAVSNNLYYQNGNGDAIVNNGTSTTQTTNFAGNPSFVAPGPPTNFHTSSVSTTGGGTTLAEVTVDYAGTGRDAPYSIGAYEDAVPSAPATPGRGLPFASTHFLTSY